MFQRENLTLEQSLKFEYISDNEKINYLDIQYSDRILEKHVEFNPHVLRNIDSYLKEQITKRGI